MAQSKYRYPEFSGALQQRTTDYIKKPNEVRDVSNADFNAVIGAICRRLGSQSTSLTLPKLPVDNNTLGAFIARYPAGNEIWAANNAADDLTAILKRWTGPGATTWTDVQTGMLADSEIHMVDDVDEVWVSSYNRATDTLGQPFTVDAAHDVSTTRHLRFAPKARFFIEFGGSMFAANVDINGTRFRDRLYKSSGQTGAITFARSPQTDVAATDTLVDQTPTMTSATTPLGVVAASSEFSATYAGYHVFDDVSNLRNTNTWFTGPNPQPTGWVRYDFGSGNSKTITYYSMTPLPNDATTTAPTEDQKSTPKDWTLEGSNDAVSWTVLHTVAAAPIFTVGEKRTYSVSNTTAYRYYRINVTANQGGSGSQNLLIMAEAELLVSTSGTKALQLEVDSARYLKPGLPIDVYKAGTTTKLFDFTVNTVDMANDIITFLPYQLNFGTIDVNTATDVITVSDATKFPTGTMIKFSSTSGLPAPLVADTVYYSIFVSSTTIKLATNLANAQAGVAINLTSQGTGTHTIRISYVFGNKDELWGAGRKGKLTRYWNTDYRNPEASDWIRIPATFDGGNDITAVGKLAARMFVWTENAMFRVAGTQTGQTPNLVPLRNDVGCISHRTIAYYDTFMVWLDSKGQVWARNEEAGEMDIISEPITETMQLVAQDTLRDATAICVGHMYKLALGTVDGKTLRVVYNFKTNQWTKEFFNPKMPVQLEYKYLNKVKPHWFDETGQMWVDEEGNDDNGIVIQFHTELGDDDFGVDELKSYKGIKVWSKNSTGTKIQISVDRGEFKDIGQIKKPVQSIAIPSTLANASVINIRFVNSSSVDPVQIDKVTVYYNREEDTFRAT